MFKEVIKNNEIIYYNGHSFYGSLNVLKDISAYPEKTYQIIFMDSCWSYAYYTKQVFESKKNADDPDGMKYADVVNNTEPGITGSHWTAIKLFENIFDASDRLKDGYKITKYSWQNLIKYMNYSAEKRAKDDAKYGNEHAEEIYGVSGVRNNVFKPEL